MWVRAMEDMGIQPMVQSYLGGSLSAYVSLGHLALTCRDLAGLHYTEVEVVVWEDVSEDGGIFVTDTQIQPLFSYMDWAHARFLWRLIFDGWLMYMHERQEETRADLMETLTIPVEDMVYMDSQGYPTHDSSDEEEAEGYEELVQELENVQPANYARWLQALTSDLDEGRGSAAQRELLRRVVLWREHQKRMAAR